MLHQIGQDNHRLLEGEFRPRASPCAHREWDPGIGIARGYGASAFLDLFLVIIPFDPTSIVVVVDSLAPSFRTTLQGTGKVLFVPVNGKDGDGAPGARGDNKAIVERDRFGEAPGHLSGLAGVSMSAWLPCAVAEGEPAAFGPATSPSASPPASTSSNCRRRRQG